MAVALVNDTDVGCATVGACGVCVAVPCCAVVGHILVAINWTGNTSNSVLICGNCCQSCWSHVTNCEANNRNFDIWWRRVDGCEPANYNFKLSTCEVEPNWNVWMGLFSGASICGIIVTPTVLCDQCACAGCNQVATPASPASILTGDHYVLSSWDSYETFGDAITTVTQPCGCTLHANIHAIGGNTDTILAVSGRALCCVTSDASVRNWSVCAGANDEFERLGRVLIPAVRAGCGCGKKSPQFKTSSTNSANTGTAITICAPSGIKNKDLILISIVRPDTAGTITVVPAGFSLVHSSDGCVANSPDLDIYAKQEDGSACSTYCFTQSSSVAYTISALRIKGACPNCFSISANIEGQNIRHHKMPEVITCCSEFSNWMPVLIYGLNNNIGGSPILSHQYTERSNITTCSLRQIIGTQTLACKDYISGNYVYGVNSTNDYNSVIVAVHPKVPNVKNVCCTEGCNVGSLTFTVPCDVLACDLLFIMIQRCTDAGTLTWPSGWASFFSEDTTNVDLDLGWHVIANSSEACDSVVVCFTTCDNATGHQYHMRGVNICCAPIVSSCAVTGSSTNPNPPSLTASCSYIYVPVTFIGGSGCITEPVCGAPACHTIGATVEVAGGCFWWSASSYGSPFCGVTSDPGTYTLSASRPWAAITVLVQANCDCCAASALFSSVGGWISII